MAELVNASLIHPRDPGSNLGIDRKYVLILFVLHFISNLQGVNSLALFVDIIEY
jgi:hypothetical protein